MSISVDWYSDAHNILHYRFTGHWTWQDYFEVMPTGREMMRGAGHYVCVLNDMRQSDSVPGNFLHRARRVIDTRPLNTGLVVFITTHDFLTRIYQALIRIHPEIAEQYILVTTLEEAIERAQAWLSAHPELPEAPDDESG